jgi:hypothetical protein
MKLGDIGTALGNDHAEDRERFRTHWEEHITNSRRMILRGADRIADAHSVTILGGGASYNIPVEELARRFAVVRLVDIDRDALERTVESLPADLRLRVNIDVADTTGGVAAHLLDRSIELIDAAASSDEALHELVPLFQGKGLDLTPDGGQIEEWKASYIVSSGLSSQLTMFPEKGALKALHEKFAVEVEHDFFLENGSALLRNEWARRHGELLASLVSPEGRVYWADTVAETPYLSEFGPAPLAAVVDSVAAFLDRAYLKTFLTDDGKQLLAERFAQGLHGRPVGGDELIQAYTVKLHGEQRRRFAWAILTLVGENRITPKRELELVTHIIREAELMYPQARQPVLAEGKLSHFFPASLEPDGDTASWLWINDPEGAVTLDGYSYYVDAQILKRI